MRRALSALTILLALVLPLSSVSAAEAEIDAEYALAKAETATHEGAPVPGGANPLYFEQAPGVGGGESCSKSPDSYCEHILVQLTNPVEDDGDPATNLTARRGFSAELSTVAADYDIFLYASDEVGTIGNELGRSTEFPAGDTGESLFTSVTTSEEAPSAYVLVRVVYFAPLTPPTLDLAF